jgi:hypothetical protein
MYTKIKTFEDACKVLNLDAKKVIPDFSLFPVEEQEAMKAHAKLIIIAKAINGDWVPDWTNLGEYKYYPWFEMGSSSGVGFSYYGYDDWNSSSIVGSRLCFENREKAEYVGKKFQELYKTYFVKG